MKIKDILIYLIIVFSINPIISKAQETPELLRLYFKEVRAGKYPAIPKILTIEESTSSTLNYVEPYLVDSSANVRAKAYTLINLVGSNARQHAVRESAVLKLINACEETDGGNVDLALSYLSTFFREDFNSQAVTKLKDLFAQVILNIDLFIKLIGFLEIKELISSIKPYTLKGNVQSIRWASLVSLARMDDQAAMEEVMRRVRKLPVNDDVIYQIFPDLVYTRQREPILYMIEQMQSDQKNCMTADVEREVPIACGYRIMEQLAPAVEGYPFQRDESGDLKTDDYQETLITVRNWFKENENFKIIRNTY
jgi:hypothetical protein